MAKVNARDTLSIGIIGAGEIVSRVHLPVLSACEGVRLAYVADINADAARLAAKIFNTIAIKVPSDLKQLPACDVALLAVPVQARMPYYELFAGRGTSVLAEKPLTASFEDGKKICSLFPEYALACGFQRRSYATVRLARRLVAANWFGPLRAISVAEGALTTKTGTDARFYDAGGSGGVLMDLGCHALDLALHISGADSTTVIDEHFIFDGDVDREVAAHMLLHTGSGACEMDYTVTWLRQAENSIQLRFDHCTASMSCRPAEHIVIRDSSDEQRSASLLAKDGATTVYQAFYLEWMSFLDGVRNRQASEFNAVSALKTVAAVEALYQAARQPQ